MLTKLIFTLVVIAVVYLVYRHRISPQGTNPLARRQQPVIADETGGIKPQTIAYGFVAILIAISAVLFAWNWVNQHKVVTIQVSTNTGERVTYQAYKKSIEGRQFNTLDGRQVTLGASDRMELSEPE